MGSPKPRSRSSRAAVVDFGLDHVAGQVRPTRMRPRGASAPDGAAAVVVRAREAAIRAVVGRIAASPSGSRGTVRRVSGRTERPGWDVEFRGPDGERTVFLVRATAEPSFDAVDVTAREWAAAAALGTRYWLVLVTEALRAPRIGAVQNPAGQVQDRTVDADPTGFRLTWPVEPGGA